MAKHMLTAWERMVASAAPAGPIPMPPTIRRSRAMLVRQAMEIKRRGLLESPSPRSMALMAL